MIYATWPWEDIRRGRCSGYPWCCVLFFTFLYDPTLKIEKNKILSWPHRLYRKVMKWRRGKKRGLGYIPCPYHLLRRT
jgi:hypothetical protein